MNLDDYEPRWTHHGYVFGFIPVKLDFSNEEMMEEYGPGVMGRWFWADWLLEFATYMVQVVSYVHPNPENIQFEFKITECIDSEFEHMFEEEDEI